MAEDSVIADIRIDASLWGSTMLPEGILERWLVADARPVAAGDPVVEVRIEDSLHAICAPQAGLLQIDVPANAVIEPGCVVGRVSGQGP